MSNFTTPILRHGLQSLLLFDLERVDDLYNTLSNIWTVRFHGKEQGVSEPSQPTKIGILGGGRLCEALLEMLDAGRLSNFHVEVAAVADPDADRPGVRLARRMGIPTLEDPRALENVADLGFIVELGGCREVLEDLRRKDPPQVRLLELALSNLLRDLIRFRDEYLFEKRQLDINEGILESIFSSMHDEVFVIGPDHRILDVNESFLKSNGVRREEVVGRHCYTVAHRSASPCSAKGEFCPLEESLATGATAHAIHEHFDHEGRARYHEVTTVPLKNEEGEVELLLEIMRDITDELEKRVEQKTRAFKMNLARIIHEDKMIALGKLVSCAVHEINNPLSGILALARLMHQKMEERCLTDEDKEQFKYYLQLIDHEAARCSTIVSNLLSFSRQQKPQYEMFQLNDLVRKVALLFDHNLQAGRIELSRELDENLPALRGDAGQIQQCLINLLFNAMEAMPEGGNIAIRTFVDRSQELVVLEVQDTGVGIPDQMMSRIFEPFFSTKNQHKGGGLGLSVVYGIVKEHLGSIYVKSEMGKGSTFSLRFQLPHAETAA